MGDAAPPDPLGGREVTELLPEGKNVFWILIREEWGVGFLNALDDQAIGRQMSMGAGIAVSPQPGIRFDNNARNPPDGSLDECYPRCWPA